MTERYRGDPTNRDPTLDGLGARVMRGITWNISGSLALQVIRTVIAIALARILAPEVYGLARMVLVIGPLVILVSDLGLGTGLIQRQHISDIDRSTVFWASVGLGVLWTLIGLASAGSLASFYRHESLRPMFSVYSLAFLIGSLGVTHAALLEREANFRGLQLRSLVATLLSGVAALCAAIAGWGAWAIIVQQIVFTTCETVLLWYFAQWRPSLELSIGSLRTLGGFGLRVFGTKAMFFLNRNTDNVLVGRFLGATPLGIYSVAYNVMLAPFSRLVLPIQFTLGPYLMRLQEEPERMARVWLKTNRVVAAIVVPATVGLIVAAPDLVPVVLGSGWSPAARVIQILAVAALLQSLTMSAPDVLAATGRIKTLFRYSILSTVLQVGGFAVGLHWGLLGVAASYAIANALLAPFLVHLAASSLRVKATPFFASLVPVAVATGAMAAATTALRLFLKSADVATPLRLVAVVAVGAVVYLGLSARSQRDVIADARAVVRRRSTSHQSAG